MITKQLTGQSGAAGVKMTTYTVPIICCQCGKQYGEKGGFTTRDPTHGYCPICFDEWMQQIQAVTPIAITGVCYE